MYKLEKDLAETELCCWFYPLTWIVLLGVSYIDWLICAAMVLILPPLLMFMHYTPSATQVQRCGVKMALWCEPLPLLSVTIQVLDVTLVIPFLSLSLLVPSPQRSVIWHQAQKCHAPGQPSNTWSETLQCWMNPTTLGAGLLLLKSCALTWNRLHIKKLSDVSKARCIQIVSHDCVFLFIGLCI